MNSFPKVSYACPIPWASLRGDERKKFCEQCGHTVTNLSELDEKARRALLAKAAGERMCITYYRRLSGEFVTPESPLNPEERSGIKQLGFAALSAGALALAAGCLATPEKGRVEAPGYLSSPAADQKSAPVTPVSPTGAEAMKITDAKRDAGTEAPIVMMTLGMMVEETPKTVRSEIDHWIQAERAQEFPPGRSTGVSPDQAWTQFWREQITAFRAHGFPSFKNKREQSGEAFVSYVITQRQKFHLPELDLPAAK